jgi:hypothetical protein
MLSRGFLREKGGRGERERGENGGGMGTVEAAESTGFQL